MIIRFLRSICSKLNLPCLINRGFDNSIIIEYWFRDARNRKLSIDLLPLFPLSNFVLFRKDRQHFLLYSALEIELPWIYIYYMY